MSELLSRQDEFDARKNALLALGAGECAIRGTVINTEDGAAFSAVYRVDNSTRPPHIIELALAAGGEAPGLLTVASVGSDDEALIGLTRARYDIDPTLGIDLAVADGNLPALRSGGDMRDLAFDRICDNIAGFAPDSVPAA
jgi:hypothetical protein